MASTYRLIREAHVVVTQDGGKPDILTIPEGRAAASYRPRAGQVGSADSQNVRRRPGASGGAAGL